MFDATFTFLDVETTGSDVTKDKIIEIGLLKVKGDQILDTYQSFVNPQTKLSDFSTKLTGITDHDLLQAPLFKQILPELNNLLQDTIIVAHNAIFDYTFLKYEYDRQQINFAYPYICSVKVSRRLYPDDRSHSLDSIMHRFNLVCEKRHRALPDAMLIYDFFKIAYQNFTPDRLNSAFQKSISNQALFANGQLTLSAD